MLLLLRPSTRQAPDVPEMPADVLPGRGWLEPQHRPFLDATWRVELVATWLPFLEERPR